MFDIVNVDLTNAFTQKSIVSEQKRIGAVTVLVMPTGATLQMQLGPNGQPFTVPGPGVFEGFDPGDEGNHGLYIVNPVAQPGVSVQLMVGYARQDTGYAANIL